MKKRMIQREESEAEVCNELVLIYPLISYKQQYFIEANIEEEEKKLVKEIEAKKKELNIKDEEAKKLIFIENVRDYTFELDVKKTKKNEPDKPSKTDEELKALALKNQAYERAFEKMKKD